MSKLKSFLTRKNIILSPKLYFIDCMSSLALGLFSTLLISTIFSTIGKYLVAVPSIESVGAFLNEAAGFAKAATGVVLGIAVAHSLKAPPLVLFSAGVVGLCGNDLATVFVLDGVEKSISAGPAGAFIVTILAVEIGKMVSKETKVDILVTPTVTIFTGVLFARLVCPAISYVMYWLGNFVNTATYAQPFVMGVIISVVVGIVLTLPISSAALCAMIGITGLAGGAATVGCCAQMVGFAVISFRENKWGGIIAQGLGTSMLQMGNMVKKPIIWLPATLASAITGPLSTLVFKLECTGVSAGMGTCGMVGPLGIFADMGFGNSGAWAGVVLCCIVLPAVLSLVFNEIMRKLGLIKTGDYKLDL